MQIDISKSINPLLASLTPSELLQVSATLSPHNDRVSTRQANLRVRWGFSEVTAEWGPCQRTLLKSLSSPAQALAHQAVFWDSLSHGNFMLQRDMKSQCSQNLSFLISGFFPNYFQINFQLIHKDEIWCMTYNPKHVVILLPISWFHGGLNKLHMWHAVFLCINGPGNPWHCPALPHSADEQWQHQGLIKFWVIFFPCLIQGEKDSQAPSSVTVLTVWDFVCLPLVGASPQKVNKVNAIFPNPCDGCAHAAQLKQLTKGARATKFPELC